MTSWPQRPVQQEQVVSGRQTAAVPQGVLGSNGWVGTSRTWRRSVMFRRSEIMTHRDKHLDMQVDIGEAQMVRDLVVPHQREIDLSRAKPLDRLWCRVVSWLQRLDLSGGYPVSPSPADLADKARVPSAHGSCCQAGCPMAT